MRDNRDTRGSYNRGSSYNRTHYHRNNDYRNNDRYNGRNDYENRSRNYNDQGKERFNDSTINPRATRTLFVGNLDHTVNKEELMRIFEHWGAIDDIDIKRPPNGIPAYAFIKYLELEAASSAKVQMYGKEISGRPIKVGYGKTLPSNRLWVGGLGQWCNTDLLNREFDRFGALRKIDYTKGSRHAFIEFESLDAASAAHAEMRGFPLGGPDRKIKIDYAEPEGGRNRSADDKDKNFDNRSDDGRPNDFSKGTYTRFNRYDNNSGGFRGRGRGGYDNNFSIKRSSSHDRDHDRSDRRRTRSRSRSPIGSEKDEYRNNRSSNEYRDSSPRHERTRIESPNDRTRNDSNTSKDNDKFDNDQPDNDNDSTKSTESLLDVSKRFVVAWRGAFALKNSAFPVRMHLIGGNPELANFFLRGIGQGAGPAIKVLSVTQRLRLDPPKLDEVSRRVQQVGAGGHCILLALATGDDIELDSSFQRRPLKSLVTYFKKKEAAGVIILSNEDPSGKQEESGMLHAFPPCEFSHQQLLKVAPNLGSEPSKEDHLVVIVVKGNSG